MSLLWNKLLDLEAYFESRFNATGSKVENHTAEEYQQYGLRETLWTSDIYRVAQISLLDVRDTKGIWMMHCCVYPHVTNNSPIFGFDIVSGKNKITGCFIDYSPLNNPDHPMVNHFCEEVDKIGWDRLRELPDWAKRIFSRSMVSVGKFKDDDELDRTLDFGRHLVDYYLEHVSQYNNTVEDNTNLQNYYCQQQKLNPRSPKVMESLGIPAEKVYSFIDNFIFPEIR